MAAGWNAEVTKVLDKHLGPRERPKPAKTMPRYNVIMVNFRSCFYTLSWLFANTSSYLSSELSFS